MNRRQWVLSMGSLVGSQSLANKLASQVQLPAKTLPVPGTLFTVAGAQAFLIEPEVTKTIGSKKWVWYAPTLKSLPGPEEKWMIERLLKADIAVAGIDIGESYGNRKGRELFNAFFQEMSLRRGFSHKPSLLARSRGGLMLYNWAAEHAQNISCIAGIYPVCDLASWPGIDKAAPAYEISPSELQAQIKEHNPIDRLSELAKAKIPIYHIHGDADKLVPLEANSQLLAQRYQALGGPFTLNIPKGQGHNMWNGFFQCQELVDFVIRHSQ